MTASEYTILRTDLFPTEQDLQAWLDSLNDGNREISIKNCIDCGYFIAKVATASNTETKVKA